MTKWYSVKKWVVSGALTVLLTACSSLAQTHNGALQAQTASEASLLGDYLVGSYAHSLDNAQASALYYARAYAQTPEDRVLGRKALATTITSGDMASALKIARRLKDFHPDEPMARAVLAVEAFKDGRHKAVSRYTQEPTYDRTVQVIFDILKGWNEVALGNEDSARESFASIGEGVYFDIVGTLQTAKLEAGMGRYASATDAFKTVEKSGLFGIETALSKARASIWAGESEKALAELQEYAQNNGGFETGPIRRYINDLESQRLVLDVLSPQEEAARALAEPALSFFARNKAFDVAEVFLRLALELDPEHHKAMIWLGSLLENNDRQDEALALYHMIDKSSDYAVAARLSEANIYFDREEDKQALAVLETVNTVHPSFVTREALGRARLVRQNYEEALPIYNRLIESLSEMELMNNPQPLYLRGICYERTGDWQAAVEDFRKVLSIQPDNADALNYLGYTWVDRGENLTEAFEMIKKAVRLEPKSGAIVDSLGWAYYKLGDYAEAKVQIEKAVTLSPSSATIVDHLGDIYWKLGRYREAGYQWERALTLDPTEKETKAIQAKLKGGLKAAEIFP